VTGARRRGAESEYSLADGKADYSFFSKAQLAPGSAVSLECEILDGSRLVEEAVSVLSGPQAQKAYEKVAAGVQKSFALPSMPLLLADEVTKKLWPAMKEAALALLCARKLCRAVLLRFHGDADGICGAFALTSVMQCTAQQQNSAVYSVRDALRDMAAIGQENRPLIVLLDFGSADSCMEGLALLKAGGIETIIIDHHPAGQANSAPMVNPFRVAEEASKYTAGYLACEIAAACGLPKAKAMELARTACSGDKSSILTSDETDAKKALVLDFLASHVSFGNKLDFYKNVMSKPELFSSIMRQADEAVEEAAEKAMAKMKRQKESGVEIISFPLEGIAKKDEWPPSGKVTTRVFDKAKGSAPLLCIGYTDRSIIMRLNDPAVALGLSANLLAERLKASMGDFVEGGGGHAKAGAIRVRQGFVREVVNEVLRQTVARALKGVR
jgi:RecJ-like exonuclease